jgi:2-polyprenyl-3-methyl-5-hydroxy-6-metoxy-1,4-benzoquinol methylase
VYVNPRINEKIINDSYRNTVDEVYVQGASGRQHTFRQCVIKINHWKKPPGRLLDIGCAAGFFVREAKDQGWDATGIEPSKWLVDWGIKNLKQRLYPGTLRQGMFKDQEFDVLTMWDVLEHVSDPTNELQECNRILKPGGMLVINYPDFGSTLAKLSGSRWWFLLSNHLYYFTQKTMRKYLKKTGFKIERFSMHWQTLPLGYLTKIFSIYSPGLSRFTGLLLKKIRMGNIPVPYYAAQTNVVAVKR